MPRTELLAIARHSLRHHQTPIYRRVLVCNRPFSMTSSSRISSPQSPQSPPSSKHDGPIAAIEESTSTSQESQQQQQQQQQPPQGLPAPSDQPITLDVSGAGSAVKLSGLGPLVVNVDGTVARINNWAQMTEAERETTVRLVSRRNKQRLDALKKLKAEQDGAGTAGASQ